MRARGCIKNHMLFPRYITDEYNQAERITYLILIYECVDCDYQRREVLVSTKGMTEDQVDVYVDEATKSGFLDVRIPF